MEQQAKKDRERKDHRATITLEPSLYIEFQTAAANNEMTFSGALRKLMRRYISEDNERQRRKQGEKG